MGMFDIINVEKLILLNNKFPPILPLSYQTKSLDNKLKSYTLEYIIENFNIREIEFYSTFNEKFFLELLKDKELEESILFNIDMFSKSLSNRWLEYHLIISRKKIIDINLIY